MATKDRLPLVTLRHADVLPGGWRNFAGKDKFNSGQNKRTFNIKLDDETAAAMQRDGFNIKPLTPMDDDEEGGGYRVEVEASFNHRPPQVWMISGGQRTLLDETSLNVLDYADIARCDVMINPSPWDVNGKQGIKAYLHKMFVTLKEDELDLEYANIPVAGAQVEHHDGPFFEESE